MGSSAGPGSFHVSSDIGSYYQSQPQPSSTQLCSPNINGAYLVPPNSLSKLPTTPSSAAKIGQIQNQIQSPNYHPNQNHSQSQMISQVRSVDSGVGPSSGQRHIFSGGNDNSNLSVTDTRTLLSQSGMSTHGTLPLHGGLVTQSLTSLTYPYSLGGVSPNSKRNQAPGTDTLD